ncbi:MATE family efflux transporter [Amaricoccus sp.]|uniref:MATE family efflux transporter n=1 Tax=Amaricoccus sp. TaxID=1872485 RepID=UPI002615B0B1|nr:MATE family efflux transporter [Amaricoccus sp.]HRO11168.1 MATE family efflux transporter [Amaricoccus sp.]
MAVPNSAVPQPWSAHVRATVVLALPLVGTQLAQTAMNVTDTLMLGWLGAEGLAAGILGTQAFFIVYIFGVGFSQAVMPLAAAAEGAGDAAGVRRAVRMGLWVLALYSALVMWPLWHAERILLALGQEPELARLAGSYVRVVMWSMLPALVITGMRAFLSVVGHAYVLLAIIVIGAGANGLLDYALIFGHYGFPALGVPGAALATALANLLMALLLVAYATLAPGLARYALLARLWRPDWRAFGEILRLGWPIGATVVAEVGLFVSASLMMGWLGAVPLAAHGIAVQLASVAFMIPLGLGNAATVRVGIEYGRGARADLGRAAATALVLATGIARLGALAFWTWPEALIGLFLDAEDPNAAAVLAYAVPLLLVAAAFQTVDSLQAVGSGLLRGVQDTRVPMLMALFSYWAVGLPVAWAFGFRAGWGGTGIWIGLALGLATAAVLLNGRFALRERLGLLGR